VDTPESATGVEYVLEPTVPGRKEAQAASNKALVTITSRQTGKSNHEYCDRLTPVPAVILQENIF
jgi:hypothetical protein